MGQYDLCLKQLVYGRAPAFFALFNHSDQNTVQMEVVGTGGRSLDLVSRDDGRWLHLEFQTEPDNKMTLRMMEYLTDILRASPLWRVEPFELMQAGRLRQVVLNFRRAANAEEIGFTGINSNNNYWLRYKHEDYFLGDLEGSSLYASEYPSDVVLSYFFKGGRTRDYAFKAIDRIQYLCGDGYEHYTQYYAFILGMMTKVITGNDDLGNEIKAMALMDGYERNALMDPFHAFSKKRGVVEFLSIKICDIFPDTDKNLLEDRLMSESVEHLHVIDRRIGKIDDLDAVLGFTLTPDRDRNPFG